MKHTILLAFFALATMSATAQVINEPNNAPQTTTTKDGSTVYLVAEEMAKYPGGLQALMQFLSENIHYPAEAEKQNISGRVLCLFIINEDGTVSDAKIKQSAHPLLDQEALRVVNMLNGWIPAKANGHAVKCAITLPITFRLPSKDEKSTGAPSAYQPEKKAAGYMYEPNKAPIEPPAKNVDAFAEFPGGKEALLNYLSTHIKYPHGAEVYGISGRVVCSFIVEKDGSITDVKVAKSVHHALDKEAVRVISSMPRWAPAMKNGQPVRIRYSLPVTFRLQEKKRKN